MYKIWVYFIFLWIVGCKAKESELKPAFPPAGTMCAAKTTDAEWYKGENKAPLFDGLGDLNYSITTKHPDAQKYFNQGLTLSYAFNHAEAARSFHYATKLDPDCAMCFWGFAYVLGPNYNAGMEPDNYERAYTAVQKAVQLIKNGSPKEADLINALAQRYAAEPPATRGHLDSAYSQAMKMLYTKYPEDPEIAALYVESVMDLHPWDLWDKQGKPKPWTPELVTILESVMQKFPKHPGVHHFYIHAVEASFTPERALASAKLFDDGIIPNAGHLVHMPSHIYIRTGDYHLGSIANINAVKIDSQYVSSCHAQGAYPLAYYPHNYHFLAATATMEGKEEWAVSAAQKVSDHADRDLMKDPMWGTLQHYYTIPYFVHLKFGNWDEVLQMNNFDVNLKYPQAIRNYARGYAFLAKNEMENAMEEWKMLDSLSRDTSLAAITIWYINNVQTITQLASKVLYAEILATKKQYQESIKLLVEAVAIEDGMNYNEPPDWFFSIRHHLGAVLIEAGQYDEAIQVYEKDLQWWPKNGWALHGLKQAYHAKKDRKALAKTEVLLAEAWKHADLQIQESRLK
ncbi:MAG: hypothetical protein IPM92_13190 [Saprospiraceae bacterium]|nr:hypothetical protein [Saprospiraceae bacterium]